MRRTWNKLLLNVAGVHYPQRVGHCTCIHRYPQMYSDVSICNHMISYDIICIILMIINVYDADTTY